VGERLAVATSKYGPHGDAVAAFLDEVSAADKAAWYGFAETAVPSVAFAAATSALVDTPFSASVQSALYSAALASFRALGLKPADMPPGVRVSAISVRIDGALAAIAVGDKLAAEHRRTLLEPFAAVGFATATAALRALDE
jgi:hypothetical protein